MKAIRPVLPLLSLALVGCSSLWARANRPGLEHDVSALLEGQGLDGVAVSCRMVATTRTGFCQASASAEQINRLVTGLGLWLATQADPAAVGFWEAQGGCRTEGPFSGDPPAHVYLSGIRPEELRLANGSAFEYMLLYREPSTSGVCIQVSYAYG